jgi:hypothetical protein
MDIIKGFDFAPMQIMNKLAINWLTLDDSPSEVVAGRY